MCRIISFVTSVSRSAVLLLLLMAGCATQSLDSVTIHLSKAGWVSIDGKILPQADLPNRLHKMGATHRTGIRIESPPDVSEAVMKDITSTLASKGFSRVMFTPPRRASAETRGSPEGK